MSPGCLIEGNARHERLDDEIAIDAFESGTLHDVTVSFEFDGRESDPAEEAARNLDWKSFLAAHPPRHRIAILATPHQPINRLAYWRVAEPKRPCSCSFHYPRSDFPAIVTAADS